MNNPPSKQYAKLFGDVKSEQRIYRITCNGESVLCTNFDTWRANFCVQFRVNVVRVFMCSNAQPHKNAATRRKHISQIQNPIRWLVDAYELNNLMHWNKSSCQFWASACFAESHTYKKKQNASKRITIMCD